MRWFTAPTDTADDDVVARQVGAYRAHLETIEPRLPRELLALATDPRMSLHDGRFRQVVVDRARASLTMTIGCGDLQIGYRELTLTFLDALIVPDDLQRLAAAVGAEFRSNDWHRGRSVTEILDQEVDLLPDGRFALRLRLWPFHEFAVEFSSMSLAEMATAARSPQRAGSFEVVASG